MVNSRRFYVECCKRDMSDRQQKLQERRGKAREMREARKKRSGEQKVSSFQAECDCEAATMAAFPIGVQRDHVAHLEPDESRRIANREYRRLRKVEVSTWRICDEYCTYLFRRIHHRIPSRLSIVFILRTPTRLAIMTSLALEILFPRHEPFFFIASFRPSHLIPVHIISSIAWKYRRWRNAEGER